MDPLKVVFSCNVNNKPFIQGDPLYFNLSHIRDGFAFSISENLYTGIDIEKEDRNIDFRSIVRHFFSKNEHNFIFGTDSNPIYNFLLLWTRKEALLKAIGTGIVDNLRQIEVCERKNIVYRSTFGNRISKSVSDRHFIYSWILTDYYLSMAVPQKAEIKLNKIKGEDIVHCLN